MDQKYFEEYQKAQQDLVIRNDQMKKQKGGCDIEMVNYVALSEVKEKTPEEKEAETLGVSMGKLRAMKEYAQLLHRRNKKMKPSSVRAKVAKKFNIKLS